MMPMHTPLLSHSPKSTTTFFTSAPLSQHPHRHVLPADHILHVYPLTPVPVDLVSRHEIKQRLDGRRAFQPRQCRAQAAVNSVAEAEILCLGAVAVDIELIRICPRPLVPVGRAADEEDRLSFWVLGF